MFNLFSQTPSVSADKVHQAIEEKEQCIILDVRSPEENAEGYIRRSVLLPLAQLEAEIAKVIPDKTKTVYVHCRSGARSSQAVDMMVKMGYTNCFNMKGGFLDWERKGYEVEKN
jgi:phage shock protein E